MADEPLVLGIETSCDETGVGIVRGTTLLADAVASSVDEHARFGGVVPEVASRAHLEAMVPTIERALKDAGVSARDLDGIAVTAGPGLAGALLVGVSAAKAYAYALGKPPVRRQPPRLPHLRRPAGARAAARADDGAAGLRRPLLAAAVRRHHLRRAPARRDHRRRGGRGLRQDRPGVESRLPRRPRHRPVRPRGGPAGDRLPARPDRPPRPRVRLLLLRAEDGRGALDRGQAGGGRGGTGAGRVGVLPGGRRGRAHPQGGAGLQGRGRRPSDDRRRCRRQLPAAGAGPGAL